MPALANRLPNRPNKLPLPEVFRVAGLNFLLFCTIAGLIGDLGGLFDWAPRMDGLWKTALIALFIPSLFEEIIFRGPLLFLRSASFAILMTWSVLGFTLWHVVEALTFLPEGAPYFLRADFLLITALFGYLAGYSVHRTGHLWPAVLMHWVMVVAWKQLLGGPALVLS